MSGSSGINRVRENFIELVLRLRPTDPGTSAECARPRAQQRPQCERLSNSPPARANTWLRPGRAHSGSRVHGADHFGEFSPRPAPPARGRTSLPGWIIHSPPLQSLLVGCSRTKPHENLSCSSSQKTDDSSPSPEGEGRGEGGRSFFYDKIDFNFDL